MLQLLSPRLPPDAIDVVSSQGPGEPDPGKLQGTEWPLVLYFELAVFRIHNFMRAVHWKGWVLAEMVYFRVFCGGRGLKSPTRYKVK